MLKKILFISVTIFIAGIFGYYITKKENLIFKDFHPNALVEIYSLKSCKYCILAKELLKQKKVNFKEYDVSEPNNRKDMLNFTGLRTVPQIFINDKHIGGYSELLTLESTGNLDEMLKKHPE